MPHDLRPPARFAAVALTAALLWPASAVAAPFTVHEGSQVNFLAKITASSFTGRSGKLSGTVDYDVDSGKLTSARVEVLADSFVTGMTLRDEHMRDNYLEAGKFPTIVFELKDLTVPPRLNAVGTVNGNFTIKGITKPTTVKIKITAVAKAGIDVAAKFNLDITDFGIEQPKFAVVKMETTLKVKLKLLLRPSQGE